MSFLTSPTHEEQHPLTTASKVVLAVTAILLPLIVSPFTRDPFQLSKQFTLYIGVLAILLLWLLRAIMTKEVSLRKTIFDVPLLTLAAVTLVSGAVSALPVLSFLGDPTNAILHVLLILAAILWCWLVVQFVRTRAFWEIFLQCLMGGGVIAALLFLLREQSWMMWLVRIVRFNTVTGVNSLFGIYLAILGTLAFGFLIIKHRHWKQQIIPGVMGILAVAGLARLGFTLSWVVFAIGIGMVLMLGASMLAEASIPTLSFTFFLFLISVVFIVAGTPAFLKGQVPLEVALGARTSWSISSQAFLTSAKQFLIGSGPGTFIYDFSRFRPDAFNTSQVAASVRFYQPFNTVFALLAEIGLLGTLCFLAVILISVGSMFGAWMKTRPSVWMRALDAMYQMAGKEASNQADRLEAFVVVVTWLTATVGLFASFYESVLWWLWWSLLAAALIGLSSLIPDLIRERGYLLQVSPQYSLLLSFSMVFLCTAVIIFATLGGRLFLGEIAYTKAVNEGTLDGQQTAVEKALTYRSTFIPYRVALARILLQQAKVESEKASPDGDRVSQLVSRAVNEARMAADSEPNNIETWDTLATMYVNARQLAPDANHWAEDALKRAIEIEPSNAALYARLGSVYEFAGNKKDAFEAYKQAVIRKPDFLIAYNSLSALLEADNNINQAISLYEPIMELVQNDAPSLYNLGRLFFNRRNAGDEDRALTVWQRALQLEPKYSDAIYSLGLLYERRGDKQKALSYYQQVLSLNPNNADVKKKINSIR